MASTFIDVGLITGAQFVFSFILVWIFTYVILGFTKLFEAQQNLRGLIALMAALLTLASPKVLSVVSLVVPWFSIIFILITFILLGLMIFGIPMSSITKMVADKENPVTNFVIIVFVIIFVAGLGFVFFSGGGNTPAATTTTTTADGAVIVTEATTTGTGTGSNVGGTGAGALMATLFHPKVLGAIFVMLLGLFTVLLLVK